MKILIVCSTLDLKHGLATTQFWWQLFKGLYEIGNDVIAIPYLGYSVESLWWRTYQNPCAVESLAYNYIADKYTLRENGKSGITSMLVDKYIKPKWERQLFKVLEQEKNVDAVVFMIVPLNHLNGIPTKIQKEFNIPVLYFDGDLPSSLPDFMGTKSFKFNYYPQADISEYNVFLSNAICAIEPLKKLGARKVDTLFYGVDTELCYPLNILKDIDVFYSGIRSQQKTKQMEYMIGIPSLNLNNRFVVGLKDKEVVNLGKAEKVGVVPMSEWQRYICRSKIALNITKEFDAMQYGTTSMRPFELASMGCCVVSDPYQGLDEWFDIGSEMFIVRNSKEAIELYKDLLSDGKLRETVGHKARQRVIRDHSTKNRAEKLMRVIDEAKKSYNN